MKKLSTLILACALAGAARAQVSAIVLEPASIAGAYPSTYAVVAQGWDIIPDMTIAANAVTDTVAMALDGSATADSLCCEDVVNTAEVAGKIAMLYRGTCNFSIKAYNAQVAGAVAVIIINNEPGNPIGMGGLVNAELVNIPVFMISQDAGATIRAVVEQGTPVVVYLGTTAGLFQNDIGMRRDDLLMPPAAATSSLLCQNASEYTAPLGAWINNPGSADQDNVTLNIDVSQNGSSVYNETSDPATINSGDSLFFELAPFSQSSYSGQYVITYTASSPAGEEYPLDNVQTSTVTFGDLFSYAPVDAVQNKPLATGGVAFATPSGAFSYCMHFRDANASRVAVAGMKVYAARNAPNSLDGELLTATAFEWLDDFTGLSDVNFTFDGLQEITYADYIVEVDTTRWEGYIPFTNPIVLANDQRYLFCLTTTSTAADVRVYLGTNDDYDYETVEENNDQPTTPIQNGTTWNSGFAGTAGAMAIKLIDVNTIGIAEQTEVAEPAFPNPTRDVLRIPLRGLKGSAHLRIFDGQGLVVSDQTVSATGRQLVVNTQGIAAGSYTFEVTTDAGQRSSFKVVISR